MTDTQRAQTLPALKFRQWLSEWDAYDYSVDQFRRKPEPHVYLFSMKAAELRKLCDVYKREHIDGTAEGIQRYRDEGRTKRIQEYVHFGYPYGDLPERRRTLETENLKKPGWLPTAIVVNVLVDDDKRKGKAVRPEHKVKFEEDREGRCSLVIPPLPNAFGDDLAPLEVIDGQHRLWAFDPVEGGSAIPDDFELPVVAYWGLDIAWQAYLFWSINVSPKKINSSHAFDLYPLLRTEDWLEEVGELSVYREARAQELTTILHEYMESPWKSRINMLGEKGGAGVSQNAWVRALISTYFATGRGSGRYGLFQADLPRQQEPLSWTRPQQAAFLIQLWSDIREAIEINAATHWWLRCYGGRDNPHRGFLDKTSMLNQDMGIRAVLAVTNDIMYRQASAWRLDSWEFSSDDTISEGVIAAALHSLSNAPFRVEMIALAAHLVAFDWRSYDGPEVSADEGRIKRSYRGSGGYTALSEDVLSTIAMGDDHVAQIAKIMLPAGA